MKAEEIKYKLFDKDKSSQITSGQINF